MTKNKVEVVIEPSTSNDVTNDTLDNLQKAADPPASPPAV